MSARFLENGKKTERLVVVVVVVVVGVVVGVVIGGAHRIAVGIYLL